MNFNEAFYWLLLSGLFLSLIVVFSDNPIFSIISLILVFCNCAVLVSYFDYEFLTVIFIAIYIGAIAILFLFVIMMLDIKITNYNIMSLFFFIPFVSFFSLKFFEKFIEFLQEIFINYIYFSYNFLFFNIDRLNHLDFLGQLLYNQYFLIILICGFILLVAMIGSIILTLKFSNRRILEINFRQISKGSFLLKLKDINYL